MNRTSDISGLIFRIRGVRVILSGDLARLYQVEPRVIPQAVKRNQNRFPADFCFQLAPAEWDDLKSQSVISSWGGARSRPYAFTEQGVAMLSSVLHSERAVRANIFIMRTFVKIREIGAQHKEVLRKLDELERRVDRHDADIGTLIDAIREDVAPEGAGRPRIGFVLP